MRVKLKVSPAARNQIREFLSKSSGEVPDRNAEAGKEFDVVCFRLILARIT